MTEDGGGRGVDATQGRDERGGGGRSHLVQLDNSGQSILGATEKYFLSPCYENCFCSIHTVGIPDRFEEVRNIEKNYQKSHVVR